LTDQCLAQPETSKRYTTTGARLISQTINSYNPPGAAPPYNCTMAAKEARSYNGGQQPQATFARYYYDEFGNLTSEVDDGVAAVGDERTLVWSYGGNQDRSAYIVGLPDYEATFNGVGYFNPLSGAASGDLKSLTTFFYDQPVVPSVTDGSASCPAGRLTKGLLTGTIAVTNAANSATWRGVPVSRSTYDAYGNVTEWRDANDNATTTMFDPFYHEFPVRTCNALDHCTTTYWDYVMGLPTAVVDTNGYWQDHKNYDPLGRLTKLTRRDYSYTTFDYNYWSDKTQRHVAERNFSAQNVLMAQTKTFTDGLSRIYLRVRHQVDDSGSVLARALTQHTAYADQTSLPYTVSLWGYDDSQNIPKETHFYDEALRQVKVVHADSTFSTASVSADPSYIYTTTTDESGHVRQVATDGYGRIAQVVEDVGAGTTYVTRQSYDALGRLTALTDNTNHTTIFDYDVLGRNIRSISPDTGTTTFEYDNVGNLIRQKDQKGNVLRFSYDALNRKRTTQHSDQSVAVWNYDEAGHGASIGRETSVVDASALGCAANASEQVSYDALGRATSITNCVLGTSYTMGMSYDALGRLRTHTYPGAETVTYTYDPAGLLYSVSGYVGAMLYDANNNLTSISYANGVNGTFTYDPNRLWLSTASVTNDDGTLYEAGYTYYADGLLKTSSSSTNPMNATFYHDGLHRLTLLDPVPSENAFAESISYDTTGRIHSRNGALYEYNDPSHLHAVTRVGGSTFYSYDTNGSLLTRNGWDFVGTWDDENYLKGVTTSSGSSVTYVYNANKQRVAEQPTPGTEKRFFGKFLEYDPSGTLTKNYFAGPLLVARNAGGVVNYFHGDRLGSTRLLTDKDGASVGGYDYRAFGEQVPRGGTAATDIRFTGHRSAVGTGIGNYSDLIFMNARFYDPVLARFISADSLIPDGSRSQALDHYAYAYNNPISNVDPTGHSPTGAKLDDYPDFSDPPLVTAEGFLAEGPVTPSSQWEWAQYDSRAVPEGWPAQVPPRGHCLMQGGYCDVGDQYKHPDEVFHEKVMAEVEHNKDMAILNVEIGVTLATAGAAGLGSAEKSLAANPFKGKSAQEIADMLSKRGYVPKGPDPVSGRGTFVNPKTGRGYHIDASHPPPKGPHVGVHRPRDLRDVLPPRDYPMGD
jgi:RHS repeat-associated protein